MEHITNIFAGWIACLLVRLMPFRIPGVEPILPLLLPLGKHYNGGIGFCFAFFNIVFFDYITLHFSFWTLVTATLYGLIGVFSSYFFDHAKASIKNYLWFTCLATLLYDGLTGLTIGPIFFNQPFFDALVGQIPFTLVHLVGNILLTLGMSKVTQYWIVDNRHIKLAL